MMITPESYIEILEDKSYENLIKERDALIKEIREFEKNKDRLGDKWMVHPSQEVRYKCSLQYLAKLCELIAETYNCVYVQGEVEENEEFEWLYIIREWLSNKQTYESTVEENVIARKNGKEYSLSDHLQGLIYSLLSNQRPWNRIVPHLSEIDSIFYNYDVDRVKATDGDFFANEICRIKCGNRNIASQMRNISKNIEIMEKIEQDYGSMDMFVTSAPAYEVVKSLSAYNSKYKLYNVGEALAWEYLRNVGIDGVKPDVHLCRFFGGNRMGKGNHSPASMREVYETVLRVSKNTGLSMTLIDSLVWNYCAEGYGEVCTANPKCTQCPIREFCSRED